MSSSERKLIVVSGFGPFIGHEEINASWEAVKLLPEMLTHNGIKYVVEKRLVPVEYRAVDEACKEIWSRQPEANMFILSLDHVNCVADVISSTQMVIHVGVSGIAKCVYVEKLAYNHKFRRADNSGQYLSNGSCVLPHNGRANVLRCGLDVDQIVEAVNATCEACVAPVVSNSDKPLGATRASKNVGDFLCGYIYLKSLDVDSKRSVFVHVPPINRPFSTVQTADIVLKIIQECVQQVDVSACVN